MKKILVLITFTAAILSCRKDSDKKFCYECKTTSSGTYDSVGCYTAEEWDSRQITDQYGQLIDKSNCRRK